VVEELALVRKLELMVEYLTREGFTSKTLAENGLKSGFVSRVWFPEIITASK